MIKNADDQPGAGDLARSPESPIAEAPDAANPDAAAPAVKTPDAATPDAAAPRAHPKDPLHGITLQTVLEQLHARYGWAELGRRIPIRCFTNEPSMGSSLAFLRRTPWARSQVEDLFLRLKKSR